MIGSEVMAMAMVVALEYGWSWHREARVGYTGATLSSNEMLRK